MSISVRPARDEDRAFIDALGIRTALETVSPLRGMSRQEAEHAYHRLAAFYRQRSGTVTLVAEHEGEPAGFLMLLTDLPDDVTQLPQAFVAYVAVAEDQRHRGAGKALVEAALAEGLRRKLPHVSLMVSANNTVARSLYASLGFADERVLMTRSLAGSSG